jgi:tryptophan-rich sensory protein
MALVVFLLIVFACAASGAAFPPGSWYAGLEKPELTPPNAVFGPVWSALYVAIAVAGWRLWRAAPSPRRRLALVLWGVQLVLNALWSWLSFGRHELGLALIDLVALVVVLVVLIATAARVSRAAAWLLSPYLLWVAFASWLNFRLWQLNG